MTHAIEYQFSELVTKHKSIQYSEPGGRVAHI